MHASGAVNHHPPSEGLLLDEETVI